MELNPQTGDPSVASLHLVCGAQQSVLRHAGVVVGMAGELLCRAEPQVSSRSPKKS